MPDRTKAKAPAASSPEYKAIAAQWARAKRVKEAEEVEAKRLGLPTDDRERADVLDRKREKLDKHRKAGFETRWWWTVGFWTFLLLVHLVGLWLFTGGFLLTRLVLEDKSACDDPPIASELAPLRKDEGCWHPKTFERAVVVVIDALRYDFTVPFAPEDLEEQPHAFHNVFPFLHDTAVQSPQNAFLRPFIADPPTTTLQRLKGLTTGTLPTFIDAGSNFAGTAIDEDNILMQLKGLDKKIAHLGDDTWWALFPEYFEANVSKAYDSFNVWDLHTVDNGVMDNIFPLMEKEKKGEWDLLIGHCLGVDHAGHRYGPDHAAMTAKLQQMDEFIRRLTATIDEDTLLVVMGDHGMDGKGDHGGESDDEVEAALWMYSKKPVFGRTSPDFVHPPANAKIRSVNQIDLVPTLSLLLGLPIPYNNLGRPIEEAFSGIKGNDWANLAAVSRMASAGIQRYQTSYKARGMSQSGEATAVDALWAEAITPGKSAEDSYAAFTKFQQETLQICKALWARFDVPRMISGVVISAVGVVLLMMYSSRDGDDEFVVTNDAELDYAEKRLELMGFAGDDAHPDQAYHKSLLGGLVNTRLLFVLGVLIPVGVYRQQPIESMTALVTLLLLTGLGTSLTEAGRTLSNLLPNTIWGWLSVIFTLSQSAGFASNSFTIWEDSILLFFITTFGVLAAISSFRIESKMERTMGIYHSLAFVVLARIASYSKLCREEQMPYCTSTYYASVSSSTSAPWQLAIPFLVFAALPSIIKSFLTPTRSYDGLAPTWMGVVLPVGLFASSLYWVIDAADNADWFADHISEGILKSVGVYMAQAVLAVAVVAGTTAFIWAPPSVSIMSAGSTPTGPRIVITGYSNTNGARYLMLPLNVLLACLILTKPMGLGALALMMWQILTLSEIIDLNSLRDETIGPIMLALLGNFYYFKTGHQAVISSIQWDSAFIPLVTIRYPWTPIVVTLNTFGPQILAAVCVPLVVLWKTGPKQKGVLEMTSRAMGAFVAYFAVEALATMTWAGHLRRHLMLYRVFSPRFMMGGLVLIVVDLVIIVVSLMGVRTNTLSVSEVFGWAE